MGPTCPKRLILCHLALWLCHTLFFHGTPDLPHFTSFFSRAGLKAESSQSANLAPNAIIIFFSVSGLLITDRNATIICANIVHKKWSHAVINVGLMAARITLYILWGPLWLDQTCSHHEEASVQELSHIDHTKMGHTWDNEGLSCHKHHTDG